MEQRKIISQKYVLRGKLFDVKQIVFEIKNKKKIHQIVERVPIVSVFPLTDKYEIYLISQYRDMLKKTVLEAVAGHIEKNETTIQAAKRELIEETGITCHQLEETARVEVAGSVISSKVYLFLAKGLEMGENDLDEDEEISIVKMSLSKAVEKVMIGEINHAASMIGILMLDKLRDQRRL